MLCNFWVVTLCLSASLVYADAPPQSEFKFSPVKTGRLDDLEYSACLLLDAQGGVLGILTELRNASSTRPLLLQRRAELPDLAVWLWATPGYRVIASITPPGFTLTYGKHDKWISSRLPPKRTITHFIAIGALVPPVAHAAEHLMIGVKPDIARPPQGTEEPKVGSYDFESPFSNLKFDDVALAPVVPPAEAEAALLAASLETEAPSIAKNYLAMVDQEKALKDLRRLWLRYTIPAGILLTIAGWFAGRKYEQLFRLG